MLLSAHWHRISNFEMNYNFCLHSVYGNGIRKYVTVVPVSTSPAPPWAWSRLKFPGSPEDSPHLRRLSTPRILGSLRRAGLQLALTPELRWEHHLVSRVSQRPVCSGEHVGLRSNRATWTGYLPAFIFSQEVDLSSRPLCIFPTKGELECRECFDHWDSGESWNPRRANEDRITGGTIFSHRQLEHQTPEITRWLKANVRILLTEMKTIQNHQNPVLPPQQVLDTPEHVKSKIHI